jgi:hypothetical protein
MTSSLPAKARQTPGAIQVFLWPEQPVGTLWFRSRNGRESASFEYDRAWLESPGRFALEPGLSLGAGTFHTQNSLSLFGALGDSAPDRWGRVLMRRQEERRARAAGERPRTLTELDYLLEINDEALSIDDSIDLKFAGIRPIRDDDNYGGFRVSINTIYEIINTPLSIDITSVARQEAGD